MRRIVVLVMGTLSGLLMVLAYPTSRGQMLMDAPAPGGGLGGSGAGPAAAAPPGPTGVPTVDQAHAVTTPAAEATQTPTATASATATVSATATASATTPTRTPAPTGTPSRTAAPAPAPATSTAGPKTFTGSAAQTQWGPVQVRITVQGGRLTDVAVLQRPSGNSHSDQINTYALPQLRTQALNAQSARIDGVSGATLTSRGYATSLQSALDLAASA
ncbi:MAG TPA: FMN-binding protein [Kineosporiaceae bacterium]|nr:FMN-binding protein [Kineosporiaceae bacterium]